MPDETWHNRLFALAPKIAVAGAGVVALSMAFGALSSAPEHATLRTSDHLTLIVFETEACIYCKRFRTDIAPGYQQSAYAQNARLRHLHVSEQGQAGYALNGRVSTVPTFVLVDRDGREIDRIRGYPGRDNFYPALDRLLAKAPRV